MRISDQEYNRLKVLKVLRTVEPVARTDLALQSGLTGGTITAIVGDLVRRGLVIEEKVNDGGLGRPRVNLRLNPDAAYVAGVIFNEHGLVVEIVNMKGESLFSAIRPWVPDPRFSRLADQIVEALTFAIENAPVPRAKIARVGIGLAAITDAIHGVIEYFESFEPGPFPMAATVEQRIGIPVTVDNDLNALARAEHWFGSGAGLDDFTLIHLDLAVGSARYADGQLHAGTHGIRPELGHIKIIPQGGRPCHCGANGCLVAYSSISGIVGQAADLRGSEPSHWSMMHRDFAALVGEARRGDPEIIAIFERAGWYLGVGLANHINVQDPDKILILCSAEGFVELISPSLFESLRVNTLPALRGRAIIEFKAMNESFYQKGCAAMVADQLYLGR